MARLGLPEARVHSVTAAVALEVPECHGVIVKGCLPSPLRRLSRAHERGPCATFRTRPRRLAPFVPPPPPPRTCLRAHC